MPNPITSLRWRGQGFFDFKPRVGDVVQAFASVALQASAEQPSKRRRRFRRKRRPIPPVLITVLDKPRPVRLRLLLVVYSRAAEFLAF